MFEDFDNALSVFNLVQVVDFVTWSRLVGVTLRSSTLDHIYKYRENWMALFGDRELINIGGGFVAIAI